MRLSSGVMRTTIDIEAYGWASANRVKVVRTATLRLLLAPL